MIKVIIVDDHLVIRNGLKLLLDNAAGNLQVVATAATAKELFLLLPDTAADIVLMDITLPEMDGLAATAFLKENYPALPVIILSMLEKEQYVAQAVQAGARGYLTKTTTRVELVQAIQLVAAGHQYIMPKISLQLLKNLPVAPVPAAHTETLSERELEVLRLIAAGHTNEEIADILFNSKRTIDSHRQNILKKTNCRNTAKLIVYAVRNQLLD